jgi:hypothetical protein
MELNDSDDLVKFINKEKKKIQDLDIGVSYKMFCKSLPKTVTTLYKRIYNVNDVNIDDVILFGCNMYFNVYWFILRYTNNYDVALFLSETGINLFLDSLISSYETVRDNPFKIIPNIGDSIKFAYKKTIGPLQCFVTNEKYKDIDDSQLAAQIINTFIVQIMKQIINNDILPNTKPKNNIILDTDDNKSIPPKIDVLLELIQNQNKLLIQNIWSTIFSVINQNSENITDKLYYQIIHYINNYAVTEENKKIYNNEMEWINDKQKQVIIIFNNVKSLIDTIKDFNDTT